MAASKRSLKDFVNFPGKLNETTGWHEFPCLYVKDVHGNPRKWQINIRLIKPLSSGPIMENDWNLMKESQVKIKPEYYNNMDSVSTSPQLPAGTQAQIWVETGVMTKKSGEPGKIVTQKPTYISKGVNEGKANERTVFHQALILARSLWEKRKDGGNTVTPAAKPAAKPLEASEAKKTDNDGDSDAESDSDGEMDVESTESPFYHPMLAKNWKDGEKSLEFPVYVQPKLDGTRCVMYLNRPKGAKVKGSIVAYSRSNKIYPALDYIKEILYPAMEQFYDVKNNCSIYLDGELYKHGKLLQDISGDSRNEKADQKSKDRNEYHIYDCFYPNQLDMPFRERYKLLEKIFKTISGMGATNSVVKLVPVKSVDDLDEANGLYTEYCKRGYEGAMLRNVDGPYMGSNVKTPGRSPDLVKLKPTFTDEFEIVGYTEGKKGKDVGAIIWICKTEDGVEFNVTPKGITYEERYRLFKEAKKSFDERYLGLLMTVEYQDLSKKGVPLRAKAVAVREE